jgi:hypothetical protein
VSKHLEADKAAKTTVGVRATPEADSAQAISG